MIYMKVPPSLPKTTPAPGNIEMGGGGEINESYGKS